MPGFEVHRVSCFAFLVRAPARCGLLRLAAVVALACATATCARVAPAGTPLEHALAGFDDDPHPDLRAVVVLQQNRIVAERYYNGATPSELHDIRSAGKSITSLLVGAAIARGDIASVDDPVAKYLVRGATSPVGAVRIEDLLTMRSGLDADDADPQSPGNEDRLDAAPDPVQFALAVPAKTRPGRTYAYNSLTTYVAGLVVESAVHRPLDAFASEVLFGPLGIDTFHWRRDSAGHTTGQGNLSLTARDLAKLGQLVLDQGRWNGREIVPAAWIEQSLRPHVAIAHADPYADHYGYFWYSKTHDVRGERVGVSFASGNGGNKIYIVPSRRMVVAITSRAYGRSYGQRRSQQVLLRALEATTGSQKVR